MADLQDQSLLMERLRTARLRPTRQRMALAALLFGAGNRHVTADQLYAEARDRAIPVSLATVYNTLNQFTHAGLLRELILAPGCSHFDTNLSPHHHFFFSESGRLVDIPDSDVHLAGLPQPPAGTMVQRVEVVIRLQENGGGER